MTNKQMDLTKNFFALGLMFWLYERSMDPTLRWIEDKFKSRPVIAEANARALKAGYAFGETTEMFHTHYRVAPAHLPPGRYRNITGNEATALGFVAASRKSGRLDLLRLVPDHAGLGHPPSAVGLQELRRPDVPGRGRDRRHRLGDRGELRRRARDDRHLRPRHRPQVRGDRARRHGRAAARRHRRPAGGSLDGHADEERAGRPPAGPVRSQQRLAGRGRRTVDAVGLFRHGLRGCPHRPQVHDPGRLSLRCLPRDGRRAVAHPVGRRPAGHLRPEPDREGRLPSVRPRSGDPRPAVGRARHARPRAPHRRPREGRHHRQRQLRPRQPPPDAAAPRRPRSPASPPTSRS